MGSKGAGSQTTTNTNTPWGPAQQPLKDVYGLAGQWLTGGKPTPYQTTPTMPAYQSMPVTSPYSIYGDQSGMGGLWAGEEGVSSGVPAMDSLYARRGLIGNQPQQPPIDYSQFYKDMTSAAQQNVAGINPNLQAAWDKQVAQANAGSSWMPQLQAGYSNMLTGDYTQDPLFQYQSDQLGRKFNEITLPGMNAAFSSGGRSGSGAQALAYGQNANELGNTLSGLSAGVYNQAKNRQLQAMQIAPQMQQLPYYDINQLGAVGEAQRQYQQQLLSAPYQQLAQYSSLLQPGLGYGTQTSSTPMYKNMASGALGGAMGGMGMAGLVGATGGAALPYVLGGAALGLL